tara:strand:+ start:123 stop:242 length:120 start_codon:yes stop_codon:yes gene_type:complete
VEVALVVQAAEVLVVAAEVQALEVFVKVKTLVIHTQLLL